jgi:hypothetical protein
MWLGLWGTGKRMEIGGWQIKKVERGANVAWNMGDGKRREIGGMTDKESRERSKCGLEHGGRGGEWRLQGWQIKKIEIGANVACIMGDGEEDKILEGWQIKKIKRGANVAWMGDGDDNGGWRLEGWQIKKNRERSKCGLEYGGRGRGWRSEGWQIKKIERGAEIRVGIREAKLTREWSIDARQKGQTKPIKLRPEGKIWRRRRRDGSNAGRKRHNRADVKSTVV